MSAWPPSNKSFPMRPGRFYDQQTAGVTNPSTDAFAENAVWIAPFYQWANRRVTYEELATDLDRNTALGADVNANVAVYRDNGNGLPGAKVYSGSFVYPDGGTGAYGTGTPFTLDSGLYWVAWVHDGDVIDLGCWDNGSSAAGYSLLGDANAGAGAAIPKAWGWRALWPFATPLPDTFVGTSLIENTGVCPRICFKVL